MAKHNRRKLNLLERELPEGLLVDAAWLAKHDFSTSLRSQYVTAGRLEQPAHRVYRRPRGSLNWQQVVISLQTLLEYPLVVGGRSALELHGFAHYLSENVREVHLYGPKPPPTWLRNLSVGVRFVYHNDRKLFRHELVSNYFSKRGRGTAMGSSKAPDQKSTSFTTQRWGQWDWSFVLSTPERAILELLDELPARESFHQVDMLMGGLSNLGPNRLQKLLADCKNVKVKRLFFFFADRHRHAWLKHLDKKKVDLGAGKRTLEKGGKLNRRYQITVPEELSGLQ